MYKFCSILVGLIILLSSCENTTDVEAAKDNNVMSFINLSVSLDDVQGSMEIFADGVANSYDNSFHTYGAFYTDTDRNTRVSAGDVTIGVLNTSIETSLEYRSLSDNSNAYGNTSIFEITGNPSSGIDAYSDSLYIPEIIEITIDDSISTHDSLQINWNQDSKNVNPVFIRLSYSKDMNEFIDSTMNTVNSFVETFSTNDDGSYTIPNSYFSHLKSGSYLRVSVARGNYKISGVTQKYLLIGSSVDMGIFKVAD